MQELLPASFSCGGAHWFTVQRALCSAAGGMQGGRNAHSCTRLQERAPRIFLPSPPPPSSRKNKIVSAEIKINFTCFFSGWESSCLTRCQKLHSTLFSLVLPDSGFFFNQIWAQSSVSQSRLQTHMKEESSQPPMQSFSRRAEKCNFEFQIWLACGSSDWSGSSSRNSSRFLQETSGISKVSPRNHTEGSPRNHSLISEGAQGLSLDPP